MSQIFFWKNVSLIWNNCSKFRQRVVKIRPQYEWISKILSPGWQVWRNWFLTLLTFLAPVIFLIHEILKKDQKMTGSKNFIGIKNQLFHAHQPLKEIFEIPWQQGHFSRTVFSKLWAVISDRRNIFSKKSLAQIIRNGKNFKWFDVLRNLTTLKVLYHTGTPLKKHFIIMKGPRESEASQPAYNLKFRAPFG